MKTLNEYTDMLGEAFSNKAKGALLGTALLASGARANKATAQNCMNGRCKTPQEVEREEGGNIKSQIMELEERIMNIRIKTPSKSPILDKMIERLEKEDVTQHDLDAVDAKLQELEKLTESFNFNYKNLKPAIFS